MFDSIKTRRLSDEIVRQITEALFAGKLRVGDKLPTERELAERFETSRASDKDGVFVFSVGGGNLEKNVSPNIVRALEFAKSRGMKIFGVVGRDGGYTKKVGDQVIVIPNIDAGLVTPHTEAFQAVVWHCLVSHPKLQRQATKW